MKAIPLTKGFVALVDDEDYETLARYKWCADIKSNTVYASRRVRGKKGQAHIRMHRVIMGAPSALEVDHINHCGIDNRKSNLRICTHQENLQNKQRLNPAIASRKKSKNDTSRYKGVHWDKTNRRWVAQISINCKKINLGSFQNELEAYTAYVNAVERLETKQP
jgi:AP2 domain/HNH endonuclease